MQKAYAEEELKLPEIKQVLSSYHAHLSHGHTYKLEKRALAGFVLRRNIDEVVVLKGIKI